MNKSAHWRRSWSSCCWKITQASHTVKLYCPPQVRAQSYIKLQNMTRHFLQTLIVSSITALPAAKLPSQEARVTKPE